MTVLWPWRLSPEDVRTDKTVSPEESCSDYSACRSRWQLIEDSLRQTGTCIREALVTRRAFLKDTLLFGLLMADIGARVRPRPDSTVMAAGAGDLTPATQAVRVSADVTEDAPLLVIPRFEFQRPVPGPDPAAVSASRLPNAPRPYRRGTHGGIDLYVPYGTAVHAIAEGLVTRADIRFMELEPELHRFLLDRSEMLQDTPPDAYERLKGRCVEIDHGKADGFRVRSIYAHLSCVSVAEGMRVRRGETVGAAGNSGTAAGVEGTRADAHLHLEVRLQAPGVRETYLGQGLPEPLVRKLLEEVFRDA